MPLWLVSVFVMLMAVSQSALLLHTTDEFYDSFLPTVPDFCIYIFPVAYVNQPMNQE